MRPVRTPPRTTAKTRPLHNPELVLPSSKGVRTRLYNYYTCRERECAICGTISATTVQTANNWYPSRLLDLNTIVPGDYPLVLNVPPLWHHLNKKEQSAVVVSRERRDSVNTIMIRERADWHSTLMERALIGMTGECAERFLLGGLLLHLFALPDG